VIELCEQKKFGDIKLISASNSQVVTAPNIRLSSKLGGGPLGDVGVYCLNAARYITRQEPIEVCAFSHQPKDDARFREVPESVSFVLRFPNEVQATCGCSFGASESRFYRVECSEGMIELDNAYSYRGQELRIRRKKENTRLEIEPVNHFAAEMDHFSECVLNGQNNHTTGEEGLADMRVMEAIEEAARSGRTVKIGGETDG
jgi:predicted dehydrogenase